MVSCWRLIVAAGFGRKDMPIAIGQELSQPVTGLLR